MQAEPNKMPLPALPWFGVLHFLSGHCPALDVDAFPDLFVDELVDVGAEPAGDVLSFSCYLFELGKVWQGVLLPPGF